MDDSRNLSIVVDKRLGKCLHQHHLSHPQHLLSLQWSKAFEASLIEGMTTACTHQDILCTRAQLARNKMLVLQLNQIRDFNNCNSFEDIVKEDAEKTISAISIDSFVSDHTTNHEELTATASNHTLDISASYYIENPGEDYSFEHTESSNIQNNKLRRKVSFARLDRRTDRRSESILHLNSPSNHADSLFQAIQMSRSIRREHFDNTNYGETPIEMSLSDQYVAVDIFEEQDIGVPTIQRSHSSLTSDTEPTILCESCSKANADRKQSSVENREGGPVEKREDPYVEKREDLSVEKREDVSVEKKEDVSVTPTQTADIMHSQNSRANLHRLLNSRMIFLPPVLKPFARVRFSPTMGIHRDR